jgi:ATP-dependent exoDNAse (exonuclease V) alpha subunit
VRVGGKALATMAIEELHGRLESGPKAIEIAAQQWARLERLYTGDSVSPHVHAQWGYCYTAHAGQGGQWPFVLVILEPSVRLNEEDGRRWLYTAVTRSSAMTAVYQGNV